MLDLLLNRYEIVNSLGSGGFGETFLAKDSHMPSQRLVVVKKLKPASASQNTSTASISSPIKSVKDWRLSRGLLGEQ